MDTKLLSKIRDGALLFFPVLPRSALGLEFPQLHIYIASRFSKPDQAIFYITGVRKTGFLSYRSMFGCSLATVNSREFPQISPNLLKHHSTIARFSTFDD
ncbi:hypothetical protein C8R42DRAFT_176600 [Lentinula raphanica]|nr:hypothetical protein C8R42DRAFT_176600 [Lentinula raphanica]